MAEGSSRAGRGHLAIAGIVKRYRQTTALAGIDLDVPPGEFLALLGPSGCGKTTLLRCIAGLVEADAGAIVVDGRPLAGLSPWKRDIGVVFQSYALFPHMNVADNIGFGLRMRGRARADIARRVEEVMALVRLDGLAGRLPAQLSGGQQQRVALARAIVVEPTLLLLDEPLAALDAKLRASVQIEIRQLQARLGLTTILVTHDQSEAMTMAHRIAVMNAGRIEQIAAPDAVYARPATPFVADFIGDMNQIRVVVQPDQGAIRLRAVDQPEGRVLAPPPSRGDPAAGEATLMVRPENLRLAPAGGGSPDASALPAIVEDVLTIGERRIVLARSGAAALKVSVPHLPGRAALLPARGEAVTLTWDPADSLLFPGRTAGG